MDDYSGSSRLLSATTLRNVLGTKSLEEILLGRETIAKEMQELLYEATDPFNIFDSLISISTKIDDTDSEGVDSVYGILGMHFNLTFFS